jgi:hypothetical protein
MAMAPSAEMGPQMASPLGALPVLKVVHRNARFLKDAGRTHEDALAPLPPDAGAAADGSGLVDAMHALELPAAEARLAASLAQSRTAAFDRVQEVVREDGNVHRVVLSWRAVDLLRVTGEQHALTLLRQSVRYCIDGRPRAAGPRAAPPIGGVVRELVERHHRGAPRPGRPVDDTSKLADTISRVTEGGGRGGRRRARRRPRSGRSAPPAARRRASCSTIPACSRMRRASRTAAHGASVGVHAPTRERVAPHRAGGGDGDAATRTREPARRRVPHRRLSKSVGAQPFDHDAAPCELKEPAGLLRESRAGRASATRPARSGRRAATASSDTPTPTSSRCCSESRSARTARCTTRNTSARSRRSTRPLGPPIAPTSSPR